MTTPEKDDTLNVSSTPHTPPSGGEDKQMVDSERSLPQTPPIGEHAEVNPARRLSYNLNDSGNQTALSSSTNPSAKRGSHHRKIQSTSAIDRDRPMGHYPPRPDESRQESPPVAVVDTQGGQPSSLQDSFSEFSNQFEESVGKPSREALLTFFYPRNSSSRTLGSPNTSRHHHRQSRARVKEPLSPQAREHLRISSLDHEHDTNLNELEESCEPPKTSQNKSEARLKAPNPPAIPEESPMSSPLHTKNHNVQFTDQKPKHEPLQSPESVLSGASNNDGNPSAPPSVSSFQQTFDAEEEEDRKYVEHFWTIYDDIIMLSLFTQLGVVARLAVSTWFTYFDGVFRADSPLFTVLPLNCLSCFILGLLGSGDRLMEVVTTRFTPRKLQQQFERGDNEDEDDNQDDEFDEENNVQQPKEGLRRRRRHKKRRPKRARQRMISDQTFPGGWQPPLHWHDDLREVQLLALERRIRASKCLILFPVGKEDADVMEHYFGEGYKASAHKEEQQRQVRDRNGRRRRRRRGRRQYCATDLADMEDDEMFAKGGRANQHHDEESDDDDDEYEFDNQMPEDDDDDDNSEPVDDGLFRFDLRLAASLEEPDTSGNQGIKKTLVSSPVSSLPASVGKLIKRSPGLATTPQSSSNVSSEDNSTTQPQPQTTATVTTAVNESQLQTLNNSISDQGSVGAASRGSQATATGGDQEQQDPQLEQIISNVQANVSENISRIRRVNIADGWDVGTTPEAMSDDIMLGLNVGFCGALSSFSSWNSSMLDLLRGGHFGEAIIGYLIGLQLPIVAYRFGQQVAVYYFVWRCRRETRRDERRGYGIRVHMDDDDDFSGRQLRAITSSDPSVEDHFDDECSRELTVESKEGEDSLSQEMPSVRAICTALYLLSLVTQCTSLSFFSEAEDQQIALSLLFSPIGSLARWRLSKLNSWRPGFPIGTFACNILACSLSGSLGSLLAGNPGPRERTVLTSLIAGFGGTLSSVAAFVVEILAGIDPLLFRFDGIIYASSSIFWALIVGLIFSASVDWADETTQSAIVDDSSDSILSDNSTIYTNSTI